MLKVTCVLLIAQGYPNIVKKLLAEQILNHTQIWMTLPSVFTGHNLCMVQV